MAKIKIKANLSPLIERIIEMKKNAKSISGKLTIPIAPPEEFDTNTDSTQYLNWIYFHEYGTASRIGGSNYTIEPRPGSGKKAVAFPDPTGKYGGKPGEYVVFKKVSHPGVRGRHFIATSITPKTAFEIKQAARTNYVKLFNKQIHINQVEAGFKKYLEVIKERIANKIAKWLPNIREPVDEYSKLHGKTAASVFLEKAQVTVESLPVGTSPEKVVPSPVRRHITVTGFIPTAKRFKISDISKSKLAFRDLFSLSAKFKVGKGKLVQMASKFKTAKEAREHVSKKLTSLQHKVKRHR